MSSLSRSNNVHIVIINVMCKFSFMSSLQWFVSEDLQYKRGYSACWVLVNTSFSVVQAWHKVSFRSYMYHTYTKHIAVVITSCTKCWWCYVCRSLVVSVESATPTAWRRKSRTRSAMTLAVDSRSIAPAWWRWDSRCWDVVDFIQHNNNTVILCS